MKITAKSGIIGLLLVMLVLSTLTACSDDDETATEMPTQSSTSEAIPIVPLTGEPTAEPIIQPTMEIEEGVADEPPPNPYLADSSNPVCHNNAYAQASTAYPGLAQMPSDQPEDFIQEPNSLILAFSDVYPDGGRVMWSSSYGRILKTDIETLQMQVIDSHDYRPHLMPDAVAGPYSQMTNQDLADALAGITNSADQELREGEAQSGLSGAYIVLDNEGILYQGFEQELIVCGDEIEGDRLSGIEIKRTYHIPEDLCTREWDRIIGIGMTYDGMVAFVTNYGLVGVIDRSFDPATSRYLQLGDGDEYVFNSTTIDEDGGIYVVTHKQMYRVQWTGEELTIDENEGGWSTEYETGWVTGEKHSQGSGSTPTLMGTGDQDKFVVITDGEAVMNVVLFWRDEIPADWEQIPGTKSRRIAAQVPITFGLTDLESSLTEQSVLVEGYAAFVVNNLMESYEGLTKIQSVLLSGEPGWAPYGCEKFEWNPQNREMRSVWVNSELSFPSAVPTMSTATNLMYCVGQRDGIWNIEAVDWDTGESVFHYDIGNLSRHNSCFAPTVIGPGGSIYYGGLMGINRVQP